MFMVIFTKTFFTGPKNTAARYIVNLWAYRGELGLFRIHKSQEWDESNNSAPCKNLGFMSRAHNDGPVLRYRAMYKGEIF